MKIKKGIRLLDETIGAGPMAEKGDNLIYNIRAFLNKGEEITINTLNKDERERIKEQYHKIIHEQDGYEFINFHAQLGRRQARPGVEYSLYNMREGGYRKVKVAPHFAYGKDGIPNKVPPNAVITFEIWLRKVSKPFQINQADFTRSLGSSETAPFYTRPKKMNEIIKGTLHDMPTIGEYLRYSLFSSNDFSFNSSEQIFTLIVDRCYYEGAKQGKILFLIPIVKFPFVKSKITISGVKGISEKWTREIENKNDIQHRLCHWFYRYRKNQIGIISEYLRLTIFISGSAHITVEDIAEPSKIMSRYFGRKNYYYSILNDIDKIIRKT